MEDFEPKEPIKEEAGENEFTLEELSFVYRAVQHQYIEICLPPMDKEAFHLASSASRKIINLMKEQHDKQQSVNGGDR